MRAAPLLALVATLFAAGGALAWSPGGHMVTAAIAYDALKRDQPAVLARVLAVLDKHPDRGAFQVASIGLDGEARGKALFEECARWPDDARGAVYDHPTWHYAERPLVRDGVVPAHTIDGEAQEALALNGREFANPNAPAADRAVALCWVMHLVGDMHQPLHATELFTAATPKGDRGGSLETLTDPGGADPISLHWMWDLAIERSVDRADVERRAQEIEAAHPAMGEPPVVDAPELFRRASSESYELGRSLAYAPPFPFVGKTTPPAAYVTKMNAVAEVRAALAGRRLAALLAALSPS